MAEEKSFGEIIMQMTRGNQTTNVLLAVGIRAVLQLLQYVMRLQEERVLSGGEVESFERFLRATGGQYDIISVPYLKENGADLEGFRHALDERKIRYHMLPDLNAEDHRFQVCVYREDRDNFGAYFREYISMQLSGGQQDEKDLLNLTDGRSSVVSLPCEDSVPALRADLDALHVNYAVLPDLKVGDGQIQLLVANNDVSRVRHWYDLYRKDCLNKGESLPEMQSIPVSMYEDQSVISVEDYKYTAPEEIRETLRKFEGKEKGEFEAAVDQLENSVKSAENPAFENYLKNLQYEMLSIDKATLMDEATVENLAVKDKATFVCRMPGTFKENEQLLMLPKDQVFYLNDSGRDRYLAFIDKDSPPVIVRPDGTRVDSLKKGSDVLHYFNNARLTAVQKNTEEIMKIAEQLTGDKPLPNPVKVR